MFTGLIESTGRVRLRRAEDGGERIEFDAPGLRLREGESIAVDGVCLTIAARGPGRLEAALIPHTLAATNLAGLVPGQRVNLEFDYLAKLVVGSGRGK